MWYSLDWQSQKHKRFACSNNNLWNNYHLKLDAFGCDLTSRTPQEGKYDKWYVHLRVRLKLASRHGSSLRRVQTNIEIARGS